MTVWFSLRRRLLLLLLGGVSAWWLAILAWTYIDAHHEIDELYDAQMAQTAQVLLTLGSRFRQDQEAGAGSRTETEQRYDQEEMERAAHHYLPNLKAQIWLEDGTLLLRSSNAPVTPLTRTEGFSEETGAKGQWRYFSQWDPYRRYQVQLAENHAVRDELIDPIAWRLTLPALLGLPLLGAWIWLATRRGLVPLAAVARQIADREPERLHALVPVEAPNEIRPLVEAINDLFARVESVLDSERRFTADAAHELRTPLAALATQAQVVGRARDEAERRHAVEQLVASSRRAARLVDQLLTLARLDPGGPDQPPIQFRLDHLAEEACADHGASALEKDISLELEGEAATVAGDPDMLRLLLRNLLDNAIRYTPTGGRVKVAVRPGLLKVSDSGPGIPPGERQRVLGRFYRLAGQDQKGSGLGLSIVTRIAERHGARLELVDGEGGSGLEVRVLFPPAV